MSYVRCEGCGNMEPSQLMCRRIKGWEQPRKQGGTNHVVMKQVIPDRYLCQMCVKMNRLGINPEQKELL